MAKNGAIGRPANSSVDYQIEGTSELLYRRDGREYSFPLREVTEEEALHFRYSGQPGFLLKTGPKLFYTTIMINMHPYSIHGYERHQCDNCAKCRALSDELGGCQKVRDTTDTMTFDRRKKVLDGKRLEKYDFVNVGYEAFNCSTEVLGIVECRHYCKIQKSVVMDYQKLNELKYSIEELYGAIFKEQVISSPDLF